AVYPLSLHDALPILVCSLSDMAGCIRAVVQGMAFCAYSDRDQHAIRLALAEALTNAIRHGNGEDPEKQVAVRHLILTDQTWVEVEDEGIGFDPHSIADPRVPENLARRSGRGLFLMRSFMDFVEYSDGGRTVLMSRRRGGVLS